MIITIVIINPRQEMRQECGWRHAQKRWAENFEDFEKDSVEFWPWCGEVEFRPWCWEVRVQPYNWELTLDHVGRQLISLAIEADSCSWDFEVGPWKTIVEFLPLGHRVGFRLLKYVVNIVWYERTDVRS